MKNWKGDEPWKKKEKQFNGKSALKNQKIIHKQSKQFRKQVAQKVTVICNKSMILPGQFKTFTVKLKNPLTYEQIMEKMKKAFEEAA
jgi:hypothetical protein